MRRLPSLLLLLAVWLHAVAMLPLHRHGLEHGASAQVDVAGDQGSPSAGAPQDDCPEPDAGCLSCAWAQLAFALAPTLSSPAAPIGQAPRLGFAVIAPRLGIPVEARQARGPPVRAAA